MVNVPAAGFVEQRLGFGDRRKFLLVKRAQLGEPLAACSAVLLASAGDLAFQLSNGPKVGVGIHTSKAPLRRTERG